MTHPQLETITRSADLDNLPVAVAHVDAIGTILRANAPLAEMLGTTVEKVEGRNLLEFGADDPARYLEMLTFTSHVTAAIMGPVEAHYHAPDGSIRRTSLWTRDCRDDPEIGAFVCVLTPEESRDAIASALAHIVEDAEVDDILRELADAIRGHPFDCDGAWLVRTRDATQVLSAHAPTDTVEVLREAGPWWDALGDSSVHECVDTSASDDNESLASLGVAAWWLMPVTGIPDVDVGILVLRRFAGPPSPNQLEHLQEITTVARLAIDHRQLRLHLAHAALHDPLTSLANRNQFFGRDEPRPGVAVLSIDLDRFKPVNDLLGHAAGDRVLIAVADRLRNIVRPGDHIARLGGDEFVIECNRVATQREANEIAERVVAAIAEPLDVEGVRVNIGASVGVAWTDAEPRRAALLELSDQALMAAKRAGRGTWRSA